MWVQSHITLFFKQLMCDIYSCNRLSEFSQRDSSSQNNTDLDALITLDEANIFCTCDGEFHLNVSHISSACIVWGPLSRSFLSNGWVVDPPNPPRQLSEPAYQVWRPFHPTSEFSVHCRCLSLQLRDRHSLTPPQFFLKEMFIYEHALPIKL